MRTFRNVIGILQSISCTLERGKRLELDHFAKLGEIGNGRLNLFQLGTDLLRLYTLKQGIA